MNTNTENDFRQHAVKEYPRECCGVVAIVKGKEKYFPCKNISSNVENFIISPEDYSSIEELGEIVAICHSHPDTTSKPSQADLVSCENTGLVWYIIAVHKNGESIVGQEISETKPSGYVPPLVGREFYHGVVDCYTLIKDWYKIERGIVLPDFDRADEWWNDGTSNLYLDNFPKAGFISMGQSSSLEVGDVILMEMRSKNGVPNHAGIYIGNTQILHHRHGRLSTRDVYGSMWRDYTRDVLRYKG